MNNQISSIEKNTTIASAWFKPVCLAAALCFAGAVHAAPSLTTSDVTFQAGKPVSVVLNFDFGSDVTFAAYDLFVTFDSSLLQIDATTPSSVTAGGFVGDTSEQIKFVDNGAGSYALSYLPSSLPNVGATQNLQLTLNFASLPAFAVGTSTDVTASFIYATQADPLNTVDLDASSKVTASAVPEPESVALLLAGAGVVAAWGRRRSAKTVNA